MDDLANFKEVFASFDTNGDGKISVEQVGDVLRALDQNPTEAEIQKCIGSFEKEARLSLEDFVPIFQSVSKNCEKNKVKELVKGFSHSGKEGNGMIDVSQKEQKMDDLAVCREAFALFDTKGDGKISVEQVGDVLRALEQNPTEAEIQRCIGSFNKKARLSLEEFVPIFQSVSKNPEKPTVEEFIEGFSLFDTEGNGMIHVAELRRLLTNLGDRLSDEEFEQLLVGHNDGQGNVNISDFVRAVMKPSKD